VLLVKACLVYSLSNILEYTKAIETFHIDEVFSLFLVLRLSVVIYDQSLVDI